MENSAFTHYKTGRTHPFINPTTTPIKTLLNPRAACAAIWLTLLLAFPSGVQAYSPNPDLTAAGAIATLKTDPNASPVYGESYNLGPTGMRGWIYIDRNNVGQQGLMTAQSRQILVTVVGSGTPASGVLAVDDVILGTSVGSGAVSLARTMQVLPLRIAGATRETRARRAGESGLTTTTMPVGSGKVKLKCGVATGFTVLKSWEYLSVQPA